MNKYIYLYEYFKTLWDKINKKKRYRVEYDTKELIEKSVKAISKIPTIGKIKLHTYRTTQEISRKGVEAQLVGHRVDRKSTRLNSSHVAISYAVFCLKKKRNKR